jgi:predicted ABC-type ATPase
MYIIASPNGCGKSTFAQEFINDRNLVFVNADIIAQELSPNKLNRAVMVRAGKIFFEKINRLVQERTSFAIETTLAGKYVAKIIEKLKSEGYGIEMIYILVETPLLSIERIKVRVQSGGHHVSDDNVLRRFSRSKINFWNLYRNLVDRWEMYDNSGKNFSPIAIGKDLDYIIINNDMFDTFREDVIDGEKIE